MGLDIKTLAAAKKNTKDSLAGAGAIVGKNIIVKNISSIDGGNRVTFGYTLDDGTEKTSSMDVMDGKDGIPGITEEQTKQISENANNIEQLQQKIEKVFQSVSDGKYQIASAITDKGIETDAKDDFSVIAENILKIPQSSNEEYETYNDIYNLVPKISAQTLKTKGKVMKDNVMIAEIPFYEVSNKTGKTAIIGGII